MRKALAGGLIRLAHCIYPPKVTEVSWSPATSLTMLDPEAAAAALRRAAKRQAQGWPGV